MVFVEPRMGLDAEPRREGRAGTKTANARIRKSMI